MPVRDTLQTHLADMRPSEAEVTRRLLRDLGAVAEKNLREVAAYCGTSDATVIRACRAAGFDGFQDLKYHVLREFTSGLAADASPEPDTTYRDDIVATLRAAENGIGEAIRRLRRARRVVLAGVGASYGVAVIAADILFTLGKTALPVSTDQEAQFALSGSADGLCLVAVSHSGETRFTVWAAREARGLGIPTIGLTNEPGSELALAVEVVIPTQAVDSPRGRYAITPRVCQLAVLDRLFLALAVARSRPGPGSGSGAVGSRPT